MTARVPSGGSWGPDGRRAAVSVSFQTLAGAGGLATAPDAPTVTPLLPTLLQALADRQLAATFFVTAATADAEPLALTMIANGGHEVAGLVLEWSGIDHARGRFASQYHELSGLRGPDDEPPTTDDLMVAGLRYLSHPRGSLRTVNGIARLPFDPRLSAASFLAPKVVGATSGAPRGPGAWHEALQIAVGQAVGTGAHVVLTAHPGLLERRDALAVFVETLDLIEGLRRAGRLWIPTHAALADWLLVPS